MDLHLTQSIGDPYHGRTQKARVLSEDWFEREGYCLSCLHRPVTRLSNNTPVADFCCPACSEPYQLKARAVPFGNIVTDGAYSVFHTAVANGKAPNLLLLHYDRARYEVLDLTSIHRKLLSPLSIIRRKPLPVTARRAGWVGCKLDLRSLPSGALIPVVRRGHAIDPHEVQTQWARFADLEDPTGNVGWLRDTLTCIQKLGRTEFRLTDIYSFERDLSRLHPGNRNIRPKIRQQLQVLCRKGLIERIAVGVYKTLPVQTESSQR